MSSAAYSSSSKRSLASKLLIQAASLLDTVTKGATSVQRKPRPANSVGMAGKETPEASAAAYVAPRAKGGPEGVRATVRMPRPSVASPRRRASGVGRPAEPMGQVSDPPAAAITGQPCITGLEVARAKAARATPTNEPSTGMPLKCLLRPSIAGANGEAP